MTERRDFLLAAGTGFAASALPFSVGSQEAKTAGSEHWTVKKTPAGEVKLFMWRKRLADAPRGPVVFVHGSSVQSQPAFDWQYAGEQHSSAMDWYVRLGCDTWCFDCEG